MRMRYVVFVVSTVHACLIAPSASESVPPALSRLERRPGLMEQAYTLRLRVRSAALVCMPLRVAHGGVAAPSGTAEDGVAEKWLTLTRASIQEPAFREAPIHPDGSINERVLIMLHKCMPQARRSGGVGVLILACIIGPCCTGGCRATSAGSPEATTTRGALRRADASAICKDGCPGRMAGTGWNVNVCGWQLVFRERQGRQEIEL